MFGHLTYLVFELVWALHASIFYIGIRKWIYGLEIPADLDAVIEGLVTAFMDGVPDVIARLLPRSTGTSRRSRRRS